MSEEEEVIDDPIEVVDETPDEEVIVENDVITVEGEEPEPEEEEEHQEAPKWVKDVRAHNRELKKKVRELESKIAQPSQPTPVAPTVGPKPKLEDFDYNSDKYDEAMVEWAKKKLKADEEVEKAKRQQQEAEKEWNEKLQNYEKAKKSLRVKDFDDAEDTVKELFNPVQQGIIVNGSEIPAELIYVIGRNPKRAKELAEIKDPVKFAFAVAKLEGKVRVERKDTPAPERKVGTGTAPVSTSSNLDRLRDEAVKTGNWEKYFAAKRKAGK